jgi:hypothetical protein
VPAERPKASDAKSIDLRRVSDRIALIIEKAPEKNNLEFDMFCEGNRALLKSVTDRRAPWDDSKCECNSTPEERIIELENEKVDKTDATEGLPLIGGQRT